MRKCHPTRLIRRGYGSRGMCVCVADTVMGRKGLTSVWYVHYGGAASAAHYRRRLALVDLDVVTQFLRRKPRVVVIKLDDV